MLEEQGKEKNGEFHLNPSSLGKAASRPLEFKHESGWGDGETRV